MNENNRILSKIPQNVNTEEKDIYVDLFEIDYSFKRKFIITIDRNDTIINNFDTLIFCEFPPGLISKEDKTLTIEEVFLHASQELIRDRCDKLKYDASDSLIDKIKLAGIHNGKYPGIDVFTVDVTGLKEYQDTVPIDEDLSKFLNDSIIYLLKCPTFSENLADTYLTKKQMEADKKRKGFYPNHKRMI